VMHSTRIVHFHRCVFILILLCCSRHEAEERVWYSRTVYGKLMSSCMVTVFSPPVLFSL